MARPPQPPHRPTTATFEESPLFELSLARALKRDSSILASYALFKQHKASRPPAVLPGSMSDHKLNPPLAKYSECHLSADECLIYTDKNNVVKVIIIVPHAALRGPRQKSLANKIKKAGY